MDKWRDCTLGDLLEIKHGYAFLGEYFGDTGTHIVLTPGNFFDAGGFKAKGEKEKWYSGPIPSDYVVNEGDVLIAMTEQAEGLLGSSAIIPRSGIYLHNQRLGLVQVRDRRATDKHFLTTCSITSRSDSRFAGPRVAPRFATLRRRASVR